MKNITKFCLMSSVISLIVLVAEPAHAWFKVCNKSSQPVALAFAYLDIPDTREYCDFLGQCQPLRRNQKLWNTTGWWNLKSGECVT
ncbi:MAG TPA: DUF1036 domain-containing protein, partial [Allocoleopsis sp.]